MSRAERRRAARPRLGAAGAQFYPAESAVRAQKLHSKSGEGLAFERPSWKGHRGRTSSKRSVRGEGPVRFIGVSGVGLQPQTPTTLRVSCSQGFLWLQARCFCTPTVRLPWRCCPSLPAAPVSHATSASLPALANRAPAATGRKEGKKRGDLLRSFALRGWTYPH